MLQKGFNTWRIWPIVKEQRDKKAEKDYVTRRQAWGVER